MNSTRTRLLAAASALLALIVLGISACGGGGGGTIVNPNGTRPVITGVSPNSANPGDRLVVTGLNFGTLQGTSSVVLGGVTFTITSWSDNEIDVTVPAGVTSGVLEVIVNGLVSQSGTQAQLFIGPAPGGAPILNTLNPNFGRMGTDIITLIGAHFGAAANGMVFFAAAGGTTVQANVVPVSGGTGGQWSDTSIQVYVPATAVSGSVYVQAGTSVSNSLPFTALPAPDGLNPPTIDSVTSQDTNIGVGSIVSINGTFFGNKQGGSTITIGGLVMQVVNWANTRIDAYIPTGATTGPITVTVGGKAVISSPVTIGNKPNITGVSPSQIKVGGSLDVFGTYFGTTQGTGTLKISGAVVTVTTWDDNHIHANVVPALTADSTGALKVVVTNNAGLSSPEFAATLFTDIKAGITVKPTAGVVGVTAFSFDVEPSGGSGSYTYQLISDKNVLGNVEPSTATSPLTYTYKSSQLSGAQKTFNTAVIVTDTVTHESVTIDGPSVLVVGASQPVITQMAVGDFSRGVDAPNDWDYLLSGSDIKYNAFTFFQQKTTWASYLFQMVDQGNPVPTFTRDESSYKATGSHPRGIAYRYNTSLGTETSTGSVVHLDGLNFGNVQGTVSLLAGSNNEIVVDSSLFSNWTDTAIDFALPGDKSVDLSGRIKVTTSTNATFTSVANLNCSAYISNVIPGSNVDPAGTVTLTGFDLTPPVQPGEIGSGLYLMWIINASYKDPVSGTMVTGLVPVATPMPVTASSGNITFDMKQLSAAPGVSIEWFNASGTASQIVDGAKLVGPATCYVYLWSGAIPPFSGPSSVVANSGLMSQAVPVNVGAGGGGGGGGVTATLSANPSGTVHGPIPHVDFTMGASGGTGPYTYDLDFGDGSAHYMGAGPTTGHDYPASSQMYTAHLVAKDSSTPANSGTKDVTVTVMIP